MRKYSLLMVLILTLCATNLFASKLPDSLSFGESKFILNGSGIKKKFMFSIYEVGLFLPQKSNELKEIYSADKKALRLYFIYKNLEPKKIKEAFEDGIALNHKELKDSNESKKFLSIFTFDIKENDTIDFYFDNSNLLVFYNGKQLATFNNSVLSKAILDIYLGENPIDKSLKNKLLGK
ncbi:MULTISPECIES: chalcone isomerase family protein [Calditerrivibrio]|uniref:chalcone isomerase family protein n=1 Tax=Calditerrivibrio TaxID=545865 RepID=UPI003C71762B